MNKDNDLRVRFAAMANMPLRASAIYINQVDYDDIIEFLGNCQNESHPGFNKPIAECDHPDCVIIHIMNV